MNERENGEKTTMSVLVDIETKQDRKRQKKIHHQKKMTTKTVMITENKTADLWGLIKKKMEPFLHIDIQSGLRKIKPENNQKTKKQKQTPPPPPEM